MLTEKAGICCTVGVVRPVVLLSRDFFRTMDEEELEAALAHEFAHIKRRDNGIALAVTLLRALTFFWPAAYVAIKQYLHEREKAADDLAVQTTGDRWHCIRNHQGRSLKSGAAARTPRVTETRADRRVQRLDGGAIRNHEGQQPDTAP